MSEINLVRLGSSAVATAACSFAVLFFVGCDLGTYSERVQSTGNSLPVTTVSQDSGSDSKDAQTGFDKKGSDSASKDAGSNSESRDSVPRSQRDEPGRKKATSLADIKEKTAARRAEQTEAESRARAADGN